MLELNRDNFETEVLEAEGLVLVDFYGDGCVPCQALLPKIHELAEVYGEQIKFTALNTSKARRLAISQRVLGLPVVALYQAGVKIGECVKEEATKANIEAMIKENI